jgi:hypothetical protein
MSDLSLVFINIKGHWIRVDQIQAISPEVDTPVSKADPNLCHVSFISGGVVTYPCSPEHILQEMGRALEIARGEGPQEQSGPLDLDAMEEPPTPSTTTTRGGESWGRP